MRPSLHPERVNKVNKKSVLKNMLNMFIVIYKYNYFQSLKLAELKEEDMPKFCDNHN